MLNQSLYLNNKMKQIIVNVEKQTLSLYEDDALVKEYVISTAKNGVGEIQDSECTPRGQHIISEKIGANEPINTVFIARKPTGEIYQPQLRTIYPDRDWILTRIMWLSGTEEGNNKGGSVDSHDRYIYLHGSPDDVEMGKPGSRGCVRMRNNDIIELFDLVEVDTPVSILEC